MFPPVWRGLEAGLVWAGQVQGLIRDVPSVAELIERIIGEASAIIGGRLASMAG